VTEPAWDELHPHTITVVTAVPGLPDDSGEATAGTPTPTVSPGWNVQPLTSSEQITDVETVTTTWRASGPLSPWIPATAQILWQGNPYRISGRPLHFTGGALDHTEITLIAWR